MEKEKKEFGKWWMWVLALTVVTVLIFTAMSYAGIFGKTVIERKVFENSYQYHAGQEARMNILEAQLEEINRQLTNTELDQTSRTDLESKAAAIRIQLSAARKGM